MSLHGLFVLATFISGLFAVKEYVWSGISRLSNKEYVSTSRMGVLMKGLFPVFLAVLAFRSIIVEPYNIPTSSMEPQLQKGDFILVNKMAYALKVPFTKLSLIEHSAPKAGDIVATRNPEDERYTFIKRIIGLPGDTIQSTDKHLLVNGIPITRQGAGQFVGDHSKGIVSYHETSGRHRYEVLFDERRNPYIFSLVVPEGHYFLMGDNRDNSTDSRNWGPVSADLIAGRVEWIISSTKEGKFSWNRMFTKPDATIF